MREKCKNWAGLEGKPGLWAWPKCRAPALTRAGLQGLICSSSDETSWSRSSTALSTAIGGRERSATTTDSTERVWNTSSSNGDSSAQRSPISTKRLKAIFASLPNCSSTGSDKSASTNQRHRGFFGEGVVRQPYASKRHWLTGNGKGKARKTPTRSFVYRLYGVEAQV